MSAYDGNSKSNVATVITPTDGAAAGVSTVGTVVDTLGAGSVDFVIHSGVITTGDYVTVIEASDTGAFAGEEVTVGAAQLIGDGTFAVTDDDTVKHISSINKLQFQRLTLVGANTPVGDMAVTATLGHLREMP
jgi:hypothetical protein